MGSGIELPAFAGTVVADASTVMALPELRLGLIPELAGRGASRDGSDVIALRCWG
jgi:enoyl-CoA hydratase/carnithine racemase